MKLSEKAYDFAMKILKLSENEEKQKPERKNSEKQKDEKRIIGSTDYKKYEELANSLEVEEITSNQTTKDILKMGCNNDRRKEKQLLQKPSKEKIEAALLFKNEGDDLLKSKKFAEALNAYEKGLLQLFYTFSDDKEEDAKVDSVKASINMNMAMCQMNNEKWDEAISNSNEALRVDKNNLKAIYRLAYCYYNLDKLDESYKFIDQGLQLQSDNADFKNLKEQVKKKENEQNEKSRKLFRKFVAK